MAADERPDQDLGRAEAGGKREGEGAEDLYREAFGLVTAVKDQEDFEGDNREQCADRDR
jgi:hypothetical protein